MERLIRLPRKWAYFNLETNSACFPGLRGLPRCWNFIAQVGKAPDKAGQLVPPVPCEQAVVCFIPNCISFTVTVPGTWQDFISISGMKPGRRVDVWSLRCPKGWLREDCLGPGVWGQPGQKRKTESLIVKITIKAGCSSSCLHSQKIEAEDHCEFKANLNNTVRSCLS